MTDEGKLYADLEAARHADRLLRDEALTAAFDAVKADLIEGWQQTSVADVDGRERIWQAVQLVGIIRQQICTTSDNGKVAQAELDHIRRLGRAA